MEDNREPKIELHYRRPSIFSSILLILMGALLATIVLLLVYIYKFDNKPNEIIGSSVLVDENIDLI